MSPTNDGFVSHSIGIVSSSVTAWESKNRAGWLGAIARNFRGIAAARLHGGNQGILVQGALRLAEGVG